MSVNINSNGIWLTFGYIIHTKAIKYFMLYRYAAWTAIPKKNPKYLYLFVHPNR